MKMENYIQGCCMSMCPEDEIKMRERERLLHVYEMVPETIKTRQPKADKNKTVKSFSRSAAGKSMQDPKNLRPPNILLKTINYLLDDIISIENYPWNFTYDFIMDRLRAVRQDMVIQNLSRPHSICFLQPIIRFYAYASYSLCEEKINTFDPHINKTHLQECLKRLLCLYDEYDELFKDPEDDFNDFLKEYRPEFEALYLILNLGSTTALSRALQLKKYWRQGIVIKAIDLSLRYINNNYISCCKLMIDLPPLLAAVASTHLPVLRRKCYEIMSSAYNSKNLTYPKEKLKDLLLYDSVQQLEKDCEMYCVQKTENGIIFQKSTFDKNKLAASRKHLFVDDKLKLQLVSSLILYG